MRKIFLFLVTFVGASLSANATESMDLSTPDFEELFNRLVVTENIQARTEDTAKFVIRYSHSAYKGGVVLIDKIDDYLVFGKGLKIDICKRLGYSRVYEYSPVANDSYIMDQDKRPILLGQKVNIQHKEVSTDGQYHVTLTDVVDDNSFDSLTCQK